MKTFGSRKSLKTFSKRNSVMIYTECTLEWDFNILNQNLSAHVIANMLCLKNCLKRKFSMHVCEMILFVLSLHSFVCMTATGYFCVSICIYIIANIFNVKFPSSFGSFKHYMYICATQIRTNSDIALIKTKWRKYKFQLLLEIYHQVMFHNLFREIVIS